MPSQVATQTRSHLGRTYAQLGVSTVPHLRGVHVFDLLLTLNANESSVILTVSLLRLSFGSQKKFKTLVPRIFFRINSGRWVTH